MKKADPSVLAPEVEKARSSLKAFRIDLYLLHNAVVRESEVQLLDDLADELLETGEELKDQVKKLKRHRNG